MNSSSSKTDETSLHPTTSVAVVGAGGVVGSELLSLLGEERVQIDDLRLFGTSSSAGEVYQVAGDEIEVKQFSPERLEGVDLVVLAMPGGAVREVMPAIAERGGCIVDITPAYRLDPGVSLIAPILGMAGSYSPGAHLSLAGASAVQIASVIGAVSSIARVSGVVATTLQSVSDAGRDGLDELWGQCLAICNQRGFEEEVFSEQIAFNCIPLIGTLLPDGSTSEEQQIAGEVRRLLDAPRLTVSATAIRVPVFHGCGVSMTIELEEEVSVEDVVTSLEKSPAISLSSEGELPMHLSVIGRDAIHVGRIRYLDTGQKKLSVWSVVDNVRSVGARGALSVIQDYLRVKRGRKLPQ